MFQFILHILFTSKITYIFYPPSFDQILEANPSTSSGVIDAPIAALDAAKVSGPWVLLQDLRDGGFAAGIWS